MKKNIVMIAFLFLSMQSYAQTEKNKLMLGGNINYSSVKTGSLNVKNTTLNLSPSVGYFVGDNLAVGVNINYSQEKFAHITQNSLSFGPFARYYFGKHDKLKPFGQIGLGLFSGKHQVNLIDTNVKGSTYHIGLGAAYFITKNVALEGFFQYQKINLNEGSNSNTLGLRIGFQIHL